MTVWLLCDVFVPKEPIPLTISDVMGEAAAFFAEFFDDLYIFWRRSRRMIFQCIIVNIEDIIIYHA
ncbi:MAG: hypothetical protein RR956_03845 [Christensenella sp.]